MGDCFGTSFGDAGLEWAICSGGLDLNSVRQDNLFNLKVGKKTFLQKDYSLRFKKSASTQTSGNFLAMTNLSRCRFFQFYFVPFPALRRDPTVEFLKGSGSKSVRFAAIFMIWFQFNFGGRALRGWTNSPTAARPKPREHSWVT